MLPLRSPLRRLGRILIGPILLLGLLDAGRALVQRTPRELPADEFNASFFHEYVTVYGLAHLEAVVPYEIRTYTNRSFFGQPIKTEPFALVPLNRPERSGNRVLLAEVPLIDDELPVDLLNRDRFEFTGLAGPLPSDLRNFLKDDFPRNAQITRIQLNRGPPSLAMSATLIACSLLLLTWLYWRASAYERSDDAQEGYPQRVSKFLVVCGLILPLVVFWKRLQLDPSVDEVLPTIASMSGLLLLLTLASSLRGRRVELPGTESDEELLAEGPPLLDDDDEAPEVATR